VVPPPSAPPMVGFGLSGCTLSWDDRALEPSRRLP
jgi:hypothetical protein